ncbi:MAG: class I SAM-dependent methyltransferase [Ignavibacteriales bacterium]|nr:class I SAM-dependent methyltransferase [Ignavibacteriales bacterium]
MNFFGDPIWENLFSSKSWGKYPPEETIRFFIRAKNKINHIPLYVLDIGCGMGASSWMMAKEGGKVTAFDGAPSGLSHINVNAKEFGVLDEIETVLGDITRPSVYLRQTYDIMIDQYSIYANPENMVIEAYGKYFNLLKPGGLFLTCGFGYGTTGWDEGRRISEHTITDIKKGVMRDTGTVSVFSIEQLISILCAIGFEIEYWEQIVENRNEIYVDKHTIAVSKPGK